MANPTTNYGWVLPVAADLVTGLPTQFDTALQGVDTSMVDLLGGTTGQVLSKTSDTDMAFTWIAAAGSSYSGASVYNSAYISIANNTDTILTFNTENFDTSSYHSTVTNTSRLTVPATGKYLITVNIGFSNNATGYRYAQIKKNGATNVCTVGLNYSPSGTYDVQLSNSVIVSATTADYFELQVYQNSGGSLNGGSTATLPVTITSLGA